jgi:ATP-dependent RNA helicase DDX27
MVCKLAQFTDIRAALVVGGLSLQRQASELRAAPDIVVATPGRIIDHVMNTMSFELDALSALVLDEADRLLELGFEAEVRCAMVTRGFVVTGAYIVATWLTGCPSSAS